MKEDLFEAIQENLSNYKHTSMNYTDYEDVSDYDIISNSEQLVLLCGYNNTARVFEYCWAANKAEDIIALIDKEQCLITFIPDEWVKIKEKGTRRICI